MIDLWLQLDNFSSRKQYLIAKYNTSPKRRHVRWTGNVACKWRCGCLLNVIFCPPYNHLGTFWEECSSGSPQWFKFSWALQLLQRLLLVSWCLAHLKGTIVAQYAPWSIRTLDRAGGHRRCGDSLSCFVLDLDFRDFTEQFNLITQYPSLCFSSSATNTPAAIFPTTVRCFYWL